MLASGLKKRYCTHLLYQNLRRLKDSFVNDEEKHKAERRLMLSHVCKYAKCLKETTKERHKISRKLMTITGRLIFKYLLNESVCTSKRKRMDSFIKKKQET